MMKKYIKYLNLFSWLVNMGFIAEMLSTSIDLKQNIGIALLTAFLGSIGVSIVIPLVAKTESYKDFKQNIDESPFTSISGVFVLVFLISYFFLSRLN